MNVFNRILTVALAVLVIIVAGAVFLAAAGLAAPGQMGPLGPVVNLFAWDTRPALTAGIAAAVLIAGITLFLGELATSRKNRRLLVKHDELGAVVVGLKGIEELVTREAKRVGGVREARSRIEEGKEGLRVRERISVAPDADVSTLSRELQERTKSAVERTLGRPVAEVEVEAYVAAGDNRVRR
ncbi:MAG: alkaline shock response membrane anchor protein AmaP [Bryobacteraceae bacterium]